MDPARLLSMCVNNDLKHIGQHRLSPDQVPPVYLAPDRLVTVRIYAAISGRTEKAIRRKIEDGKWLKDREFVHDPDGAVMIDREAVQRWVLHGS